MKTLIKTLPFVLCLAVASMAGADVIDDLNPVFRLVADDLAQADGTPVNQWADVRTGSGIVLDTYEYDEWPLGPTGAARTPTYATNVFNGHAAVRFDKANRQVLGQTDANTDAAWNATAQTLIVVFTKSEPDGLLLGFMRPTDAGNNRKVGVGQVYGDQTAMGTSDDLVGVETDFSYHTRLRHRTNLSGPSLTDNTPYWAMMTVEGGVYVGLIHLDNVERQVDTYLDGVHQLGGLLGPSGPGDQRGISIGGSESNWDTDRPELDFLEGDVADAIIFDRVLSAADMAIVEAFMVDHYGIPEPATMVLLGIGVVSLLIRRKR